MLLFLLFFKHEQAHSALKLEMEEMALKLTEFDGAEAALAEATRLGAIATEERKEADRYRKEVKKSTTAKAMPLISNTRSSLTSIKITPSKLQCY